ncbi:MAG: type II toxin-antitoxin system PrlF family antitoxin [Sulfuricella sp.]|nr:type II toxin-antitoxin system PrlF family antitoxin [Sulfuricella sp.]MBS4099182.1 type II toxin-antitoxin system PrlF family antitoxin [Sulfuricella sp.]
MTVLHTESTLTARYQTTIPDAVRKVLGLNKHDRLVYRVCENGEVYLSKADIAEAEDAALGPFLSLLDSRLAQQPGSIVPYSDADAEVDLDLVKGVELG